MNVLAPGKRTMHTICPALALKDGKPVMAWNTPGGDNQPQAMLQAFLNVVEFWDERAASPGTAYSDHDEFPPHDVSASAGRQVSDPEVTCGSGWNCTCPKGHKVQVRVLQQPYSQTATTGAVKMIVIDRRTGMIHGEREPSERRLRSRLVSWKWGVSKWQHFAASSLPRQVRGRGGLLMKCRPTFQH